MDTIKFIEKAKRVWGDKFDYSDVIYKNNNEKVKIKFNDMIFYQSPKHHLAGHLPLLISGKCKYQTNDFIIRAQEVHGNKYDYSKVNYIDSHTKICIICPEHGEFWQTPTNHLSGNGCPGCKNENLKSTFSNTTEQFIKKAKKVHGDKYDYSKVEYINNNTKVCIICPEHGEFWQEPHNHLQGKGCSKCTKIGVSNIENDIYDFIYSMDKTFIKNDRSILNGYELDILSKEKKIAFEINGLYWHSEKFQNKKNLLIKTEECEKQGIRLIHIFEDEWLYKKNIVKSRILNFLNKTCNHIYARNCEIKEITDIKVVTKFLNDNHIQGAIGSKYKIGLYYNNELVSLMTFGRLRKNLGSSGDENDYELLRFCNKLDTNIVGGASKLFKFFIKHYNPKTIISYADRRWSQGELYEKLNFKFIRNSIPNYFYLKDKKRCNRFNFRKDMLITYYNCPIEKTEKEFCYEQGWYRIYDCGSKVYKWKKE